MKRKEKKRTVSAGNKKQRIEVKKGEKTKKEKKKRDIKIFLCKLNTSETSLPGPSWTVSGSESARTRVHTVADCIFAISSTVLPSIPAHFLLLLLLLLPPPLSRNSDERRRLCGSGNDQGTDSVERVEGETMRCGEKKRAWRQRWRPAVSEDRPLNHRTEFHLAFGLLSAESTTYLPVDLPLLRLGPRGPFPCSLCSSFSPPGPLFFVLLPLPNSSSSPLSLFLDLFLFPLFLWPIFLPRDESVLRHRMRPACCTFHGRVQPRIMNIDNSRRKPGLPSNRRPFEPSPPALSSPFPSFTFSF